VNRTILRRLKERAYDILWVDKGQFIRPDTLRKARKISPGIIIVFYSPDDMTGNKANQTQAFLDDLPLLDYFVTTKSYCVNELKALGCRQVILTGNAFDQATHRPMEISREERQRIGGAVGFVGQYEEDRGRQMIALAQAGVPVRVWGYTWEKCPERPECLTLENRPLWAEDYSKAICAFDINLCFLRKANRDLQTTRSVEIPACGAFMLGERSSEHLELFEEGKEAEFFDTTEELIDKTKYYLAHDAIRRKIAQAGRERCLKSGYSNHDRMRSVLEQMELKN
jgi:spore maturation protein CgeB